MGAEVGATTSTFPYSDNMRNYLHATGRGPVADAADRAAGAGFLEADQGAEYDEVIEIVRSSTSHLLYHLHLSSRQRPVLPVSTPRISTSSHPVELRLCRALLHLGLWPRLTDRTYPNLNPI